MRLPGTFHYDRDYTCFRQLSDCHHLDFAAEVTTAPSLTDAVQAYLEQLLHEIIVPGQRPRVDYHWSGVMSFGLDLASIVGWVQPGVLAAVRCNGMGVSLGAGTGWQAAELLAG